MYKLGILFGSIVFFLIIFASFFLIFLPLSESFPSNPDKIFSAGGLLNLWFLATMELAIGIFWLFERISYSIEKRFKKNKIKI